MALLDGELPVDEAQAVSAHLEHCAECAELVGQFRAVSGSLASWTVDDAPASFEESVMAQASAPAKALRTHTFRIFNWKLWALGGAVATALLLYIPTVGSFRKAGTRTVMEQRAIQPYAASQPVAQPPTMELDQLASGGFAAATRAPGVAKDTNGLFHSVQEQSIPESAVAMKAGRADRPVNGRSDRLTSLDASTAPTAPMIARTIDLNIMVRDFPAARGALDAIVARHHGYAAHLSATTTDNTPRILQDSLRIPSPELASAVAEIKSLGRVIGESQTGEEVTQQHADLAARLQNSRETEERLRDILAQRTGKIEDVLQVEEEIARVRGEIERMESDQKTLEHRVDFASVDLYLNEEYKEQFGTPSTSVSTRIGNAFVNGMRNAASMLLGMVLFIEEAGPVVMIWLAILGVPALLLWRRYRRMRAKV
jgi:anti-sigma factor RsiW